MPLYKLELPIEAKDEKQARELKTIMLDMYSQFGFEGIKAMYKEGQSGMGKIFTNKFRKLKVS